MSSRTMARGVILVGLSLVAAFALSEPFGNVTRRGPSSSSSPPRPLGDGLVPVDGPTLLAHVRQSRARGIVVNAWASWCGSCKGDMPMLLGLEKTFGTSIDIWFVSVDEPETRAAAASMLRELGAPLPSYIVQGPLGAFKSAMNPRWPGMLPATFLFDPTGKLRFFFGGPVLETEITSLLRRYLAGEHIDGEANFALAPGAVTR